MQQQQQQPQPLPPHQLPPQQQLLITQEQQQQQPQQLAPQQQLITQEQQQQQQQQPDADHEATAVDGDDSLNQRSSLTSSTDEKNDSNDRSLNASGLDTNLSAYNGKIPNSYKYPQLRRYFEFGPWVGRNRKALCLACHMQSSSSQPDRLLKHLNRCNALSDTDKAEVAVLMNERTANKRKPPSGVRLKRENDNDSEFFAEDGEPAAGLADDMTLSSVNASHNSISTPNAATKRIKREHSDRNTQVDQALTKFIMVCRIPLKAIHSKEFIDLVRALDPDYHIPSRETITNVLIPGMLNII